MSLKKTWIWDIFNKLDLCGDELLVECENSTANIEIKNGARIVFGHNSSGFYVFEVKPPYNGMLNKRTTKNINELQEFIQQALDRMQKQ